MPTVRRRAIAARTFGQPRETRISSIACAASLGGCATKPKLPPGVHPSVEVGPPLKSDTWKSVATPADQDRLARLGLAWSDALADATKSNAADVRREGKLLLPRS